MNSITMNPKLTLIESPFAGEVARNLAYLRVCMLDSFRRGEAPFASHKMYTDVLDDGVPEERAIGIAAGLSWGMRAQQTAVYNDLGISPGMQRGTEAAVAIGRPVIVRSLMTNCLLSNDFGRPYVSAVIEMVRRGDGVWVPDYNG